jgi:hypothetical protein
MIIAKAMIRFVFLRKTLEAKNVTTQAGDWERKGSQETAA